MKKIITFSSLSLSLIWSLNAPLPVLAAKQVSQIFNSSAMTYLPLADGQAQLLVDSTGPTDPLYLSELPYLDENWKLVHTFGGSYDSYNRIPLQSTGVSLDQNTFFVVGVYDGETLIDVEVWYTQRSNWYDRQLIFSLKENEGDVGSATVSRLVRHKKHIYLLTSEGMWRTTSSITTWEKIDLPNLSQATWQNAYSDGDQLFITAGGDAVNPKLLQSTNGTTWTKITSVSQLPIKGITDLTVWDDHLYIAGEGDSDHKSGIWKYDGSTTWVAVTRSDDTYTALFSNDRGLYLAKTVSSGETIIRRTLDGQSFERIYKHSGVTLTPHSMVSNNNKTLLVMSGGERSFVLRVP